MRELITEQMYHLGYAKLNRANVRLSESKCYKNKMSKVTQTRRPRGDYLGTAFSQNSFVAHPVAQSERHLTVAMATLFPQQ